MTSSGKEVRPIQPVYALVLVGLLLLFASFVVYTAKGTDWFGGYEKPITTGAPMLVVQDQALLIFLPGSTYYKFPNKAAQAQSEAAQGSFPAPILPTAVPPKAQP